MFQLFFSIQYLQATECMIITYIHVKALITFIFKIKTFIKSNRYNEGLTK